MARQRSIHDRPVAQSPRTITVLASRAASARRKRSNIAARFPGRSRARSGHPGDVDVAEQIEVSTPFTLGAHDPGGHRTVIVARMDDGAKAGPEARPRPERGTGLGQGLISLRRMVSLSIHGGARSRPCCGEVMYAH